MKFHASIQNFTGIYQEQPFVLNLAQDEKTKWIDCTQIRGTDCLCDEDAQKEIRKTINDYIETWGSISGIHFFDNGNYHYISKLWTDFIQEDFDLIVFDHHPDMQPPRFEGILSCGGWVKEVLDKNSFVQNILIVGVSDALIDELKQDETFDFETYLPRVKFIKESSIRGALNNGKLLEDSLMKFIFSSQIPIYVSIDKDVFSQEEVITNWDQGALTFPLFEQAIKNIFQRKTILGVDICGERSWEQDGSIPDADKKNNNLNEKIFNLIKSLYV